MGDSYRDALNFTPGRDECKQKKMPHSLAEADTQTHALTCSPLNNQLWNLQDESLLFPQPGSVTAIIIQSSLQIGKRTKQFDSGENETQIRGGHRDARDYRELFGFQECLCRKAYTEHLQSIQYESVKKCESKKKRGGNFVTLTSDTRLRIRIFSGFSNVPSHCVPDNEQLAWPFV